MRRAARRDGNHGEIRDGLRALGWSVLDLGGVGDDCPDTLCGAAGVNVLFEIKNPRQPASKRRLRPGQQDFFDTWRGSVYRVESLDEAVEVMTMEIQRVRAA